MLKNSVTGTELLEHRFLVAHKRPKNLRDILVKAKLPTQRSPVTSTTTNCNCITCNHWLNKLPTIKSTTTGATHSVAPNIDCQTENCIYLIQCRICDKQYIGETSRTLRARYTEHRSRIKNKHEEIVYAHFNDLGHNPDDVLMKGVQRLATGETNVRRRTEQAWITMMRSHAPSGLNDQQ